MMAIWVRMYRSESANPKRIELLVYADQLILMAASIPVVFSSFGLEVGVNTHEIEQCVIGRRVRNNLSIGAIPDDQLTGL